MKHITIGYIRDDGDVAVLATLNNNDEHLSNDEFEELIANTVAYYTNIIDEDVRAWERQDAPDYLDYDSATFGTDVTPEED